MSEPTYTAEQFEAIGGRPWTHPGTGALRIYLNGWQELAGIEIEHYKSGNVSSASVLGQGVSNRFGTQLGALKVWWEDGALRHPFDREHVVADLQRYGILPTTMIARLHEGLRLRITNATTRATARDIAAALDEAHAPEVHRMRSARNEAGLEPYDGS